MDNIKLFEYSIKNFEEKSKFDLETEEIVITKTVLKKNNLMENNKKLIDLITSYQTLKHKLTVKQQNDIIKDIDNLLFNANKMNYTALSQYFLVWNKSYSYLKSLNQSARLGIIKVLINKYIINRHSMYQSHGYSDIVLQVISDNYSHKRRGMTGIRKIELFLHNAGIDKYDASQNIKDGTFYLLPDKEGKKAFEYIKQQKNINLKWAAEKQNKMPDTYIQKGSKIYIIEHKFKQEGGGGQNSQIVEMVDFIKNSDKNVSYISFMDGALFARIIGNINSNKLLKIKQNICKYLRKHKSNYFVNDIGFKKLLEEIIARDN